ncbi:hypothetical protein BH24ACT21_BH24ACT21_10880 [soil metagenome]|jgi:endonuclease YncB( thermonuclease family)
MIERAVPYEEASFDWLAALRIVTVRRVVDGDTVEISPSIDGIKVVRLIGIDTPETHFVAEPEPYAEQASRFTRGYLINVGVRI